MEIKHNTYLNNHWAKEENKRGIRKYLKTNENKNLIHQNVWNTVKAVQEGHYSDECLH